MFFLSDAHSYVYVFLGMPVMPVNAAMFLIIINLIVVLPEYYSVKVFVSLGYPKHLPSSIINIEIYGCTCSKMVHG